MGKLWQMRITSNVVCPYGRNNHEKVAILEIKVWTTQV